MERRGLRFRDRDFAFGDDYFLWLALALDRRLARVDDVLVRLRQHADSTSSAIAARRNWLAETVALLDEFVRTFPDAEARLGGARRLGIGRHWAWAALYELDRGRRLRAARYAARAAAHDPAGAARLLARGGARPRRTLRRLGALR
jgi:hypothetical protein